MRSLADCTILVVEDEWLISTTIEDALNEAGCERVHCVATNSDAALLVARHRPDIAVLDVRLKWETSLSTADLLAGSRIPFVFFTSVRPETLPLRHRERRFVGKPDLSSGLVVALREVLASLPLTSSTAAAAGD